jgi:crossover junction endodeoxyribonuclease RuvC
VDRLRVLGIDPGTLKSGWAVVDSFPNELPKLIDSDCLVLGKSNTPIAARLHQLHINLREVIAKYRPDVLAIESAFFGDNAQSALRIGEARGVVLMMAAEFDMAVDEIPPATVKRRIAGNGRATKEQVYLMTLQHLGCSEFKPSSEDESDAVAIALCYLLSLATEKATSNNKPKNSGKKARSGGKLPLGSTFQ